jgi:Abortive infection C-terminus
MRSSSSLDAGPSEVGHHSSAGGPIQSFARSMQPRIPNLVAEVVGEVVGWFYYSHRRLEMLFAECGAPGDPPPGNTSEKCVTWLKRASADPQSNALGLLGAVLEKVMDGDWTGNYKTRAELELARDRVRKVLSRSGLEYIEGGTVRSQLASGATKSLAEMIRDPKFAGLQAEFDRALTQTESDPGAAVTAACAIIEALCKVYIEDESLSLPSDQSIKPLWRTVQSHLGLDAAAQASDDLKRVLGGLSSIVDGVGSFRTHAGSAHGHSGRKYRPAARHARLVVNAAHTLTSFVLETWRLKRPG